MNQRTATLYTRPGCHLCEEAQAQLKRHGFRVESVNIDTNPLLQERYGDVIPVVLIDGKERFRGRIDPRLLTRLSRQNAEKTP